jgi:hypothetical protein
MAAMRRFATLAVLVGCGSTAPVSTVAPGDAGPSLVAPPAEAGPAEAGEPVAGEPSALLERLNGWCASYPDECLLFEYPREFPDRVSSGESNGFLGDAKERLAALGVAVAFDREARRYRIGVEPGPPQAADAGAAPVAPAGGPSCSFVRESVVAPPVVGAGAVVVVERADEAPGEAGCATDADCELTTWRCDPCGVCPGTERSRAVLRSSLAAALEGCVWTQAGDRPLDRPACSPCSGPVDGFRDWSSVSCRDGRCVARGLATR